MRTVNPTEHARKRARILSAAAQEFAANGMDGASTAGICRRAGIGSGTLFHYFATKRDIFYDLFAESVAGRVEVCERALAAEPSERGFDLLVEHLVADFADPLTPGLAAAAILQANRDHEFATLLATDEERTRHTLTTLLGRMAAPAGRMAVPDRQLALAPDRAAVWILSLIDASYWMAGRPDFDAATQTAELRRIIALFVGRDPSYDFRRPDGPAI